MNTLVSRSPRAYKRGRTAQRGVAIVEFAIVAPLGFLLLISIVITGIVVTNYIQMTNVARDGARIAAICGSGTTAQAAQMPDGSGTCSDNAIETYVTSHLVTVPAGSVDPQIFVCTQAQASACSGSTSTQKGIVGCYNQAGAIIEVDMYYDQPLYLPVISSLLGTNTNGTRRLYASAQATCE